MSSFIQNKSSLLQFDENLIPLAVKPNLDEKAVLLKLEDVLVENEDVLEAPFDFIQTDVPANIEELIAFYSEPTASDSTLQNNRLSPGTIIQHTEHPLHIAARDGDIDTIITLLEDGFDINDKDSRNIMPIHVAALFGQNEAVQVLISYGSDVNVKGYEDNTALHFALVKQHYDVAMTLLIDGKASPLTANYYGKTAATIILEDLHSMIFSSIDIDHPKTRDEIEEIIALTKTMLENSSDPFLYSDISEFEGERYVTPFPASLIIQFYASRVSSPEVAQELLNLAKEIAAHDSSEEIYLCAKDLLHFFPTGEIYKIDIGQDKKVWMPSEGHLGTSTTNLAAISLYHFTQSLNIWQADPLKIDVFQSLNSIYNLADNYASFASLEDTALMALKMYDEGYTVLLPSGWDGHFIDVILSKTQGLYIVANSGDRYHGESPDYEGDPAGIIFYHILEPDAIDGQFMYNILNNVDRMVLEYENAYEYGIFEKIDEIVRDTQTFGNCGWESHRDAVEGLLYIELLNHDVDSIEAKVLAHDYYQDWDAFHGSLVISRYMDNEPGLPLQALLDIFNQIHQKDHFTINDHNHAQKIADALVSEHYIEDFKVWLTDEDHGLTEKLMKNIFQEQHGINIEGIIASISCNDDISVGNNEAIVQPEMISVVPIETILPALHQEPVMM